MPSSFAWVDIDETSRRRMLDVIEMFRDQDTLDDLGIGTIRDAFADHFFPGTSTIQTRARYFLFIPWIYLKLERKRTASSDIARMARSAEVALIKALLASGLGDGDGVIGRISQEKLKRLPSNIYWVGLHSWRIRIYPGTQDQYHRSLNAYYRRMAEYAVMKQQEREDAPTEYNWDPHLPELPEGFPLNAVMDLTKEEARYLQERISISQGDSLLAAFVNALEIMGSDYLWENPVVASVSETQRHEVEMSRIFSGIMHGAVLLYYSMLARAKKNEKLIDNYEKQIEMWAIRMESDMPVFDKWYSEMELFWNSAPLLNANIGRLTREFVKDWCVITKRCSRLVRIYEDKDAMDLIMRRERTTKGEKRARLCSPRYLEMWQGNAGLVNMLSYRWDKVQRIVKDIHTGLNGKKS